MRLRGGGGRGSKASSKTISLLDDGQETHDELNKYMEKRSRKIKKSLKMVKKKWVGTDPVPRKVLNKWKGDDAREEKKAKEEAYEPKFVAHVSLFPLSSPTNTCMCELPSYGFPWRQFAAGT